MALYQGETMISKNLNCKVTPFLTIIINEDVFRAIVHHVPLGIDGKEHLVSDVILPIGYLEFVISDFKEIKTLRK